MTTRNAAAAVPARDQRPAGQAVRLSPEARRRQRVLTVVAVAAIARRVLDKRTLRGAIVLAIGLAAIATMGKERGVPALDWYRRMGQAKDAARPG